MVNPGLLRMLFAFSSSVFNSALAYFLFCLSHSTLRQLSFDICVSRNRKGKKQVSLFTDKLISFSPCKTIDGSIGGVQYYTFTYEANANGIFSDKLEESHVHSL